MVLSKVVEDSVLEESYLCGDAAVCCRYDQVFLPDVCDPDRLFVFLWHNGHEQLLRVDEHFKVLDDVDHVCLIFVHAMLKTAIDHEADFLKMKERVVCVDERVRFLMQLTFVPSSGKAACVVCLRTEFLRWLLLSVLLSVIVASIALYVYFWRAHVWEKVLPVQWVQHLRISPRRVLSSYELVAFGYKLAHLTAAVSCVDETTRQMMRLLSIDLQSIDQRAMDNDFGATTVIPGKNEDG